MLPDPRRCYRALEGRPRGRRERRPALRTVPSGAPERGRSRGGRPRASFHAALPRGAARRRHHRAGAERPGVAAPGGVPCVIPKPRSSSAHRPKAAASPCSTPPAAAPITNRSSVRGEPRRHVLRPRRGRQQARGRAPRRRVRPRRPRPRRARRRQRDRRRRAVRRPWPMFETVLAGALQVANARVPSELRGDAAREAVQAFTLTLYKGIVESLGEVVEDDEKRAGRRTTKPRASRRRRRGAPRGALDAPQVLRGLLLDEHVEHAGRSRRGRRCRAPARGRPSWPRTRAAGSPS
jgi:hypothetical protein